jgi:hypothetical protein
MFLPMHFSWRFLPIPVLSTLIGVSVAAGDDALPQYGTTVITHGYQFSGSLPAWPGTLAEAIRLQAGGGRIFQYQASTGTLALVAGSANEAGETVLIFDWAADSNDSQPGRSEAAADALLAALIHHSRGPAALIPSSPLHLIGHSRGTVVNSEVAERLIANGLTVAHVTTLDPHDWGNAGIPGVSNPGVTDWDVNAWHPEYPRYDEFGEFPGVQTWEGIEFADNYFQQDGSNEVLTNPWGKPLPGAANLGFPDSFDIRHSQVHAWYHGTVDTLADTDGTGITIPSSWYDNPGGHPICNASSRDWSLARSADGFWFSDLGGGSASRCPESEYSPGVSRVTVGFSYALPEGIVNGDFERGVSGWSYHGGELIGGAAIGNGVLDLSLSEGAADIASATHNRFYIPPDRTHIRACLRVVRADPDDRLRIKVGLDQRLSRKVDRVTPTCEELSIPINGDRDTIQTFTLELVASGSGTARVFVDDVAFLPSDLIFVDGFESGSTLAWSGAAP